MINSSLDNLQPSDRSLSADSRRTRWGAAQLSKTRYGLLLLCVACQAITILITWPLWQIRAVEKFTNLPVFELPQISFGALLVISLFYLVLDPKRGVFAHLILLGIASVFDQMRLQPQFLAIWILMFACVSVEGTRIARWFLASMWLWAGIHKLLSHDWFGLQSWSLVERAGLDANAYYLVFATVVAISEISIGLAAIFKPRWAAVFCPFLHFGIILFLSPLFLNWNHSVIPWNLANAIVGFWIMWQSTSMVPLSRVEWAMATLFLVTPIGFYFGVMDHGYAHVLYSDNLPHAVLTTNNTSREIIGWGELRVSFPNERRLLRQYFYYVGKPGNKLHIYDPRAWLPDQYFEKNEFNQIVSISESEFFATNEDGISGNSYDNERSIFQLGRQGATMKKKSEDSEIFAILFDPELFTSKSLQYLSGLQNIREIQFADCKITDDDLKFLAVLKKLRGIGLDDTNVSDKGLIHLRQLPSLQVIEHNNTRITESGLRQLLGGD